MTVAATMITAVIAVIMNLAVATMNHAVDAAITNLVAAATMNLAPAKSASLPMPLPITVVLTTALPIAAVIHADTTVSKLTIALLPTNALVLVRMACQLNVVLLIVWFPQHVAAPMVVATMAAVTMAAVVTIAAIMAVATTAVRDIVARHHKSPHHQNLFPPVLHWTKKLPNAQFVQQATNTITAAVPPPLPLK